MDEADKPQGLENNSSGGLSMFRDIDRSEAFYVPDYHARETEASFQSLES